DALHGLLDRGLLHSVPTRRSSDLPSNASSMLGGPGMAEDEVTLAQVLKSAGYVTGHVGKWHLGYSPKTVPTAKGFDSSFGHMGRSEEHTSELQSHLNLVCRLLLEK